MFEYDEKEHSLHLQLKESKEEALKLKEDHEFKIKENEKDYSLKHSNLLNDHEKQINKTKSELE